MFDYKSLIDYTNLFSPHEFKKNDQIIKDIIINQKNIKNDIIIKDIIINQKNIKNDIIIKDIIINQKNIKMFISVQDYLNVKVKFTE